MIQFKNYEKGREFLKKNEPFIILWLNQSIAYYYYSFAKINPITLRFIQKTQFYNGSAPSLFQSNFLKK